MRVCIRADASIEIGTGHVMRCLTLAEELEQRGAEVFFVCRQLPGHLCDYLEHRGKAVVRVTCSASPNSPGFACSQSSIGWQQDDAAETKRILTKMPTDWLIVDHYSLDEQWESLVRPCVRQIMVIDDLANRRHDCDLLLDQNLYQGMEKRYQSLVPLGCRTLIGPRFALLRTEFLLARRNLRQRTGKVERVLIFFGGSDPTNQTAKSLNAVSQLDLPNVIFNVVAGHANPSRCEIEKLCKRMPGTAYHSQVDNMAELMAASDLAIGGGGASTWERCFLGLPTIMLILAENQAEVVQAVATSGAAWNLGWGLDVSVPKLAEALHSALMYPDRLKSMSEKALSVMGKNNIPGTSSVADYISPIFCDYTLRPAEECDLDQLLYWRNSPHVRENMYTDHLITMDEHRRWFANLQHEHHSKTLVFEIKQKPIGIVNIRYHESKSVSTCNWGFYIGEHESPPGVSTIMGYLGLEYIFKNSDTEEVIGEVLAFNYKSIAYHKRLGFSIIKVLKQHILKKGRYEDIVVLRIDRNTWAHTRYDLMTKYS